MKKLSKPILLIAFFTGLYASLRVLSALNEYYNLIDKIFFIIIALLCALLVSNMVKVAIVAYLKIRKKFEGTPRLLDKAISVIIFTSNFRIF